MSGCGRGLLTGGLLTNKHICLHDGGLGLAGGAYFDDRDKSMAKKAGGVGPTPRILISSLEVHPYKNKASD
ncbi:hypothetical protein B296_00003267 [Ensete ventricosum]|uniref:Uncharacterized protein n=1 Tax=Ensete ventricosum TaxID=4639 RepID=A0A427B8K6_ENSVE|nr:hypothetical protein B296_00003267 [Ensete ventricosum]